MTEFLAFAVPDLFSLKKNDYFYNRDYKLIQTEKALKNIDDFSKKKLEQQVFVEEI